jgi:PAS domain S-box-containing protein
MKNKKSNIKNALERYKLVVEKSSEMIAFADLKGKITFVNNSWVKGHGYKSAKEIIGKNISIFHPKKELARVKEVNRILRKNKKWKGEIFHKRKDGSVYSAMMDNFIFSWCGKKTMVEMAIDITEVKNYQECIITEKEKAEKYLQLAGNMIVSLDFEGNISLINDAGLKILGYKNGELIGKNWFDTCLPKIYRKEVKEVFAKIVKGNVKPVEKYENPILTKSGEERIISWFNTILKDKDDKIIGILSSGMDITERKKAEQSLLESQEKYKRLSKNVPGMIYVGYPDWSAEFIKGSKEICGYSTKEINKGKINWTDLIHPDDKASVLKEGAELAKKQKYLVQNYRIIDKSKKIVWVEDKKTSYFSKDGKFLNIHGIVFDITKRKLIEEKLKESENKFRRLFETAKDGILIIDYDTDKITDANPFLYKLLGYKENEVIGKEIFEISPIKDIIPNKAKFKELKNKGYVRYSNLPLETKKGRKAWVEFISNVYRLNGKVVVQANIRDITDSKIAEEKLLESEEKYKNIFSYAGDASFVMKLDPKKGVVFLECNENTLKLFGVSKKEIIGSSPLKFSPKNQPDGELSLEKIKRISKLVKKGENQHFEWEHINYKNKKSFFVDVSLSLIIVKGEMLLLAVVKDITEKKKIMEEMDKLASIVKNTTNLVNLSDTNGKMVFINKAGSEMLGIKEKDVGNHNIMEVIPDHLKDLVTKELLPKLLDGKMWRGDLEYKNIKTGKLTDVNASTFSIKDSKTGKVKYFANTSSNITKRKKIEDDLIKSEARMSATLDSMGDGLFVVDIEGRVIMFNKFASEITGFSPKEVINKKFRNYIKFVYEDEEKRGDHFIIDSLTQGKTTRLKNHIQIVGKRGLKIPVSSSASPIMDKDGKIIGSVVVFRDITVEKEVDKMKSEFVSLASHQLKTPLTGTRWFTELLLKEKKGKLNKEQKNYLEQIKFSNERLIKLVEDLLDVSHIETGRKFSIEKRSTDLVNIVNESIKEKMDLINRRKIEIVKCKHAPDSFVLKIDGKKIRQVFDNLVDNAIKYSEEGGMVEIGCNQEKKDRVIVYIKDTGIGIPIDQQKNIFTKFFRAYNAVKTESDGTGLGLYIAKAIVLAHGGDMWFESKPGKGSTFYFSLPLN